jgi:hypothetical protein
MALEALGDKQSAERVLEVLKNEDKIFPIGATHYSLKERVNSDWMGRLQLIFTGGILGVRQDERTALKALRKDYKYTKLKAHRQRYNGAITWAEVHTRLTSSTGSSILICQPKGADGGVEHAVSITSTTLKDHEEPSQMVCDASETHSMPLSAATLRKACGGFECLGILDGAILLTQRPMVGNVLRKKEAKRARTKS